MCLVVDTPAQGPFLNPLHITFIYMASDDDSMILIRRFFPSRAQTSSTTWWQHASLVAHHISSQQWAPFVPYKDCSPRLRKPGKIKPVLGHYWHFLANNRRVVFTGSFSGAAPTVTPTDDRFRRAPPIPLWPLTKHCGQWHLDTFLLSSPQWRIHQSI